MSKIAALGALVFLALTTGATGQPLPEQGVPPEWGVLYAWEPLSGALIARTREVSVRLDAEQSGDDEFAPLVLTVENGGGRSARHPWPEGTPFRPDEIYLLDGYACDQKLIDVVVRSPPPKYADLPSFLYVRFLIDAETLDLKAVVAYDPSIGTMSGVVPIQSVTAPDAPWPVFSVACDGGEVESVTVRDGYGP